MFIILFIVSSFLLQAEPQNHNKTFIFDQGTLPEAECFSIIFSAGLTTVYATNPIKPSLINNEVKKMKKKREKDLKEMQIALKVSPKEARLINRYNNDQFKDIVKTATPLLIVQQTPEGNISKNDQELINKFKKVYGDRLFVFPMSDIKNGAKKDKSQEEVNVKEALAKTNDLFRLLQKTPLIHPTPPDLKHIKASTWAETRFILPLTALTTVIAYYSPSIDQNLVRTTGLFLSTLAYSTMINYFMVNTVNAINKSGDVIKISRVANYIIKKAGLNFKNEKESGFFKFIDSNINGSILATTGIIAAGTFVARTWLGDLGMTTPLEYIYAYADAFNRVFPFWEHILKDAAVATVTQAPVFMALGKANAKGIIPDKYYAKIVITVNQGVNLLLWFANLGDPTTFREVSFFVGAIFTAALIYIHFKYPDPKITELKDADVQTKKIKEVIASVEKIANYRAKTTGGLTPKKTTECWSMHNSLFDLVRGF